MCLYYRNQRTFLYLELWCSNPIQWWRNDYFWVKHTHVDLRECVCVLATYLRPLPWEERGSGIHCLRMHQTIPGVCGITVTCFTYCAEWWRRGRSGRRLVYVITSSADKVRPQSYGYPINNPVHVQTVYPLPSPGRGLAMRLYVCVFYSTPTHKSSKLGCCFIHIIGHTCPSSFLQQ